MKPIAQTFYVNEPENGVAGVYLTGIDLYFKSKSPIFGVQVQIRTTDNGNPTTSVLPFADVKMPSSGVLVSNDASLRTYFYFPSPVFLQSATSYAIVVIPLGSNPDYQIWTAEIGGTDVTTNSPIKTNNDTGTLFLSSNDIQFTSIQTEDIKFTLYIADFKSTSGTAIFTPKNSDYVMIKNKNGNFFPREKLVISNSSYYLAKLTITSNTGPFNTGEVIYQSNSTGNVASGIIYSANDTAIKITNSVGKWTSSYQVKGATSLSNAVVSATNSSVITTFNSNTISVPFNNIFAVGHMLYIGASRRTNMQPTFVTAVNSDGVTITVSSNLEFTDNKAIIGRIRGDGLLYADAESLSDNETQNRTAITLDNVTSNASLNFANAKNEYLIGTQSGASAIIIATYDSIYNAIVPQFAESRPGDTDINWFLSGVADDSGKSQDLDLIPLINNVEKELYDYPRSLMSRSNEYTKLVGARKGSATTLVYANYNSSNNKISPVIDVGAKSTVTTIGNVVLPQEELVGYRLLIEDSPFNPGDVVVQQNMASVFNGGTYVYGQGTVKYADDTQIFVSSVNGYFNGANSIMLADDSNVNAWVTDSSMYNERLTNNNKFSSRYISKNVVLAEGQDAEDIRVFLTAYRPAGTDFLVYGRFLSGEDPDAFQYKNWTLLKQISSPSLLSSGANINDFVELEYGLPRSEQLAINASNCNVSSETMRINASATEKVQVGDFIYVADTTSDKFFVSKIRKVVNTNLIMLIDYPPFSIPNGSFGVIPNLETTAGAFVYSANNNVIRYVSANNNVVFDTYKTFAIKIVPIANSTALVPRARNMRAIALQV